MFALLSFFIRWIVFFIVIVFLLGIVSNFTFKFLFLSIVSNESTVSHVPARYFSNLSAPKGVLFTVQFQLVVFFSVLIPTCSLPRFYCSSIIFMLSALRRYLQSTDLCVSMYSNLAFFSISILTRSNRQAFSNIV